MKRLSVSADLERLQQRLEGAACEQVEKEVNYLEFHRDSIDYVTIQRLGEPTGSGATESTCRQCQACFERTRQFWSQTGDEALTCLETFRRNGRRQLPFPRSVTEASKN